MNIDLIILHKFIYVSITFEGGSKDFTPLALLKETQTLVVGLRGVHSLPLELGLGLLSHNLKYTALVIVCIYAGIFQVETVPAIADIFARFRKRLLSAKVNLLFEPPASIS